MKGQEDGRQGAADPVEEKSQVSLIKVNGPCFGERRGWTKIEISNVGLMEPPVRSSSQLEPGNTLLRSYFTSMSVVASQEVLFSLDMDMIKKNTATGESLTQLGRHKQSQTRCGERTRSAAWKPATQGVLGWIVWEATPLTTDWADCPRRWWESEAWAEVGNTRTRAHVHTHSWRSGWERTPTDKDKAQGWAGLPHPSEPFSAEPVLKG